MIYLQVNYGYLYANLWYSASSWLKCSPHSTIIIFFRKYIKYTHMSLKFHIRFNIKPRLPSKLPKPFSQKRCIWTWLERFTDHRGDLNYASSKESVLPFIRPSVCPRHFCPYHSLEGQFLVGCNLLTVSFFICALSPSWWFLFLLEHFNEFPFRSSMLLS